ncbi:MAG: adenylosuccinate synthase [Proteobacteria bacterium]|nr:adenylosuccinate synthase [Pseudomonadota bacterium]
MSQVNIVVGAQWGDEGKGKWVDVMAKDAQIVARFQGGNNAGHTIWINGTKYVLHQIPSGVFQKGLISAMAAGVVIHPTGLVQEIEKMKGTVEITPKNLWISARAHVITPWHIHLDGSREAKSASPIGTTKRGIGPTYSEKANRTGLRMGQFVKESARKQWIHEMIESDSQFKVHYESNTQSWNEFHNAAGHIAPFVCDVETKLRKEIASGKNLLLEGAQGTLLDLDHGTYPFVTSSSTAASGACSSIGFSPKSISNIYGIAKAYVTRVGSGPFVTELFDDVGADIAKKGHEFGATTGRPRRCGWFDAVAFRYSAAVNGFDGVIINKIDILTNIKELKICTKYAHPELGEIEDFPWDAEVLAQCKPVYESYPGWTEEPAKSGAIQDLPKNAFNYIKAIEKHTGCKGSYVGTGPGRTEMLSASGT